MSDQAAHQSAHRSTRPVTVWKSETVTPFVVNRGAQCAIADATRSSMRRVTSLQGRALGLQTVVAVIAA